MGEEKLAGLNVEQFKSMMAKPEYRDHPDREILTMLGIQILFQTGEKTIYKLIAEGLPHRKVGQSYRFVRRMVIAWLEDESNRQELDS